MLILFLISSSASLVLISSVSLAIDALFDENECLRRDRLIAKKKDADCVKRLFLTLTGFARACYLSMCGPKSTEELEEVEVQFESLPGREGQGALSGT